MSPQSQASEPLFAYSRQGLTGSEQRLQRLLELIPGAISWCVLLGMVALSWWLPLVAAAIVIAFYLYWLLRLFYLTLFLIISYLRLSSERETEWMERVRGLDRLDEYVQSLRQGGTGGRLGTRLSRWLHRQEIGTLQRSGRRPPPSEAIHHVVIVPIVREARCIYEPGIQRLAEQEFPAGRILVVLAVEERCPAHVREEALQLAERYRNRFLDLLVVFHPDGLPGEARVKGANATWAAKQAAVLLERRRIPFEHTIVSCFDADTVVSPHYVSCLTYTFMACPQRTRASFQPIPLYHNNIWEVPGFARVLDVGSSFLQLVEATNPAQLVTFSSHSMSFSALVDVGYWPVDMISDDSAIFWKSYLHCGGDYRVIPMSTTVSMDVAASASWWRTALNVYRQKRRWAWGVENFPIVTRGFLRAPNIRLRDKARHLLKMLENHVSWATWPFLLTAIGWLPGIFAGREFATSVMYYTAPRVASTVFHLASLALLATIAVSLLLLPKPPARIPILKQLVHAIEWLSIPLIAMWLGAVPALDAQTRLLRGRYMEFWVTEKTR